MGVSLNWKPVKPDNSITFASGSAINKALIEAFGELPVRLSYPHIERLKGIRACGFEDIDDLIEALEKNEQIEVDSQY